jgi:peptidoglycan hydrolase-like protein with peptidoglycan-binding domain
VQEALTALGYQPGAVDGKNGPKTSAALAAFQKASELPPTGKFDPQTKAAMAAALAAKKLPRPAPPANHGPAWGPDMRD